MSPTSTIPALLLLAAACSYARAGSISPPLDSHAHSGAALIGDHVSGAPTLVFVTEPGPATPLKGALPAPVALVVPTTAVLPQAQDVREPESNFLMLAALGAAAIAIRRQSRF